MIERLALGTAQFGLPYGVANVAGKIPGEEVHKILGYAHTLGIDTLDTAIAYGDSEKVLGDCGVKDWKIISKLPAIPEGCTDVVEWVKHSVHRTLDHLGCEKLDGLLLHRPDQLFDKDGAQLLDALQSIKDLGLTQKIGVSIYDPHELESLFDLHEFDLIQSPLNILDRRLVETGWAQYLLEKNVEIHIRSVFLQGLLLMPSHVRPKKFSLWSDIWDIWDRFLEDQKMTPLQACLGYVLSIAEVDRIIVGVDSLEHLQMIAGSATSKLENLPLFHHIDAKLLNPACWDQI